MRRRKFGHFEWLVSIPHPELETTYQAMVSIFLASDLTVGSSSSGYDKYIPKKRDSFSSDAWLTDLFLIQFDFAVEPDDLIEAVALFTPMSLELLRKSGGLLVSARVGAASRATRRLIQNAPGQPR